MKVIPTLIAAIFVLLLGYNLPAMANNAVEESKADIPPEDKVYQFTITDFDKVLGDIKAPIDVIVYSSFTCPHCASFEEKIFPELDKRYIQTGKIRYVHRDYPMDRPGLYAASLALCQGGEHYYAFLKILFNKQDLWAFKKNYQEVLTNIGKLGGVSAEAFDACIQDKKIQERLTGAAVEASKRYDVNAVPALFVNGISIPAFDKEKIFATIDNMTTEKGLAASK